MKRVDPGTAAVADPNIGVVASVAAIRDTAVVTAVEITVAAASVVAAVAADIAVSCARCNLALPDRKSVV